MFWSIVILIIIICGIIDDIRGVEHPQYPAVLYDETGVPYDPNFGYIYVEVGYEGNWQVDPMFLDFLGGF